MKFPKTIIKSVIYGVPSDLIINPEKYLFVTEVGSRMWRMEKFASDYDLFHVYQTPSREYLINGNFGSTKPAKIWTDNKDREIDAQYMEIGHLTNLLKKGNVNAIWAVCSGVIHKDTDVLRNLREIVLNNLSKASYQSIRGMSISQLKDVEKRKGVRDPQKNLVSCRRTQLFGINLLLGSGISFCPTCSISEISVETCKNGFEDMKTALEISPLPEEPNPVPFDDFIYRLRMKEILDNNIETGIVE
jgi:hypothetical protein